jgi:predicted GNAT family acetyltransferase
MEILEGHNKFYVNDAQGNQVAEIVFVPTGEHLSIIEHTDVDPSLKGQGVGKQLVAKVVEKMRQEQRKIILSARLPNMNSITPANTTIFAPDVPAPVLTGALFSRQRSAGSRLGKAADQIREISRRIGGENR